MSDSTPEFIKFWKDENIPNLPEFVKTREYEDISTVRKVELSVLNGRVKEACKGKSELNENSSDSEVQKYHYIYICSLGIVVPRRGEGLGEVLMEHVFKLAYKNPNILCVTLHVQVSDSYMDFACANFN